MSTDNWRARLPSAFVVLALAALMVVPLVLQRRVDHLRDEIENGADPARTIITAVQYMLALQTSSLRGFLLTAAPEYRSDFARLVAEEREAYAELEPLVQRLGPEATTRLVELRAVSDQWHASLRGLDAEDPPEELEEGMYRRALEAAQRLDDEVLLATRTRRERIRSIEREGLVISGVLAGLGLAAILVVIGLSEQVRRLAVETEVRRSDAERALAETVRAVEARAYLIRGVTHDVKNPLGAADGYAGLLEMGVKGELTPAQLQVVTGIRRSIRGALAIIADLLDLSHAESGGLRLEREATSVAVLLSEVADEHVGAAQAAGHTLHLEPPAEPIVVHTDAGRVRQILGNLVSNALKYTPAPGRVTLDVDGAGGDGAPLRIRVTDSGPGIPPQHRERIFEEFHRLDARPVGHGLGLAISRRIARLLGGDVTVEEVDGGGGRFVLHLPREGSER